MQHATTASRTTTTGPFRRASASKAAAVEMTSETIARDIATFRKQGGRIEVLGNTPLRAHVAAYRSRGNTAVAAPAAKRVSRN